MLNEYDAINYLNKLEICQNMCKIIRNSSLYDLSSTSGIKKFIRIRKSTKISEKTKNISILSIRKWMSRDVENSSGYVQSSIEFILNGLHKIFERIYRSHTQIPEIRQRKYWHWITIKITPKMHVYVGNCYRSVCKNY